MTSSSRRLAALAAGSGIAAAGKFVAVTSDVVDELLRREEETELGNGDPENTPNVTRTYLFSGNRVNCNVNRLHHCLKIMHTNYKQTGTTYTAIRT